MRAEIEKIIKKKDRYNNIWRCYEDCKVVLKANVLTCDEYNVEIKRIADKLNI